MTALSVLFPSSGSQIIDQQTFTASGTWTKPAGVLPTDTVIVEMWGGGGGGAVRSFTGGDFMHGTPGAGGAHNRFECLVSDLFATEPVVVGAGGAAVTSGGSVDGNSGGMSSFKGRRAYGGGGGSFNSADNTGFYATGGGTDSAGAPGNPSSTNKAGGRPLVTQPYTNSVLSSFEDTATVVWVPGDYGGGCSYGTQIPFEYALPLHGGAAGYVYANADRRYRSSVWGGAGGGGCTGSGHTAAALGGLSEYGGNGGDAIMMPTANSNVNGNDGQPRGGGGSSARRGSGSGTVTSGAGGRGEVVITIIRR